MRGVENKGKLILISHPPSKIRVILSFALLAFIMGVAVPVYIWAFLTTPGVVRFSLSRTIAYLGSIVVSMLIAFVIGVSMMQYGYRVYENGLTVMYPTFLNWLFHRNKKEGKFVRWEQMLGYIRDDGGDRKLRKLKQKGLDTIVLFYWNYEDLAIRMEMFGENMSDVDVVERELKRHGVREAPMRCPRCGKELLGFDYLYNRCETCGTEIFKLPEGAKIMPWIERHREMRKR